MAIKFPTKPTAAEQTKSDEAYIRQQDANRAAADATARAAYPDEDGVGDAPADDGIDHLPYANTFEPLRAGNYTFLCCVEQITHWDSGPSIVFRVRVGDDAGRELKWDQTPPHNKNLKQGFIDGWKRTLFGAYASGGWTAEPNPSTGWPGWAINKVGSLVPPYADFFVVNINDVSVPIMLAVKVQVQARTDHATRSTYDPKIISVRKHLVDGALVQAPLPRKVTPWIAEMHRWRGERADITVKPSERRAGCVIPSVKVVYDQIERGFGGLLTLKDIA